MVEEELQLTMDMDPNKLEIRQPYSAPLWWTVPPVSINRSMEAAVTNHNINEVARPSACRIYTNGSGINGLVGSAAVSLNPSTVRKAFMGTATESSVPIAELAGLILAFQIAEEPLFRGRDLEIYTDNQGALQAVSNPRQASGQYLVQRIIDAIANWKHSWPNCTLHLYWIPAHG